MLETRLCYRLNNEPFLVDIVSWSTALFKLVDFHTTTHNNT